MSNSIIFIFVFPSVAANKFVSNSQINLISFSNSFIFIIGLINSFSVNSKVSITPDLYPTIIFCSSLREQKHLISQDNLNLFDFPSFGHSFFILTFISDLGFLFINN